MTGIAVRTIHDTISESERHADRATPTLTVRSFSASDVDFVISRQLALYKSEYGFTSDTWIAYLTEGVQNFVQHFDPGKDCMNILKNEGGLGGLYSNHACGYSDCTITVLFFRTGNEGAGRRTPAHGSGD